LILFQSNKNTLKLNLNLTLELELSLMKFLKFFIPFLIIGAALFQSCGGGTEADPIEFGYDYFPLEIGKYIGHQCRQ